MCTISYKSLSDVLSTGMPTYKRSIKRVDKPSISSSFDLSWLDPLPELPSQNQQLKSLPTFHDFQYCGRLGDGVYAKVYCARHISSKKYVAIKVADGRDKQARQQLEVEKEILFRYGDANPYIVKAYCAFHQGVC